MHCSTLQRTATHGNTLQHTPAHCNTLQHTCDVADCIECVPARCVLVQVQTLQHAATHCDTPRHSMTHCNTLLQHTRTHSITSQIHSETMKSRKKKSLRIWKPSSCRCLQIYTTFQRKASGACIACVCVCVCVCVCERERQLERASPIHIKIRERER